MSGKGKKKSFGVIIAMLILILGVVVAIYFTCFRNGEADENSKNNNSGESMVISGEVEGKQSEDEYISIGGVKKLGALEFSNMKVKLVSRNKCEFLADVKNTSEEYLKSTNVSFNVVNSDGEIEGQFGGVVSSLAPYEPYKFKIYVREDITDAKDIQIEVVNE